MGILTGLLSLTGEDVSSKILEALRISSPAIGDAYGIASSLNSDVRYSLPDFFSILSKAALGYKLVKIMPLDNPQPLHQMNHSLILEGRIWERKKPDILVYADYLVHDDLDGLKSFMRETDGSYAAALLEEERILFCKDAIGTIPLYYGINEEIVGVASNLKALRIVGIEGRPAIPGAIYEISKDKVEMIDYAPLIEPDVMKIGLEEAVEEIDLRMTEAVTKRCIDVHEPVLSFSGGLDSFLVAYYLNRSGCKPFLSCVGFEDSEDPSAAESAADKLDLPLKITTIDEKEVEENIDVVLSSVEDFNPLKVSIALPLYFVAREAANRGKKIVFSGNGCDEVFGGYAKYLKEYAVNGESVREMMFNDVLKSYEVNFDRDWKICSDHGVELRLPFTDRKLIELGLSLPTEYKISKGSGEQRKIILRALTSRLGFSSDISMRPKKAAQYSSGALKILKKLAKKSGLNISGYLYKRWMKLRSSKN